MASIIKSSKLPWELPTREVNQSWSGNDPNIKLYHTHKWRKLRALQINQHPFCVECKKSNKITLAKIADHIKPVSKGGSFWDKTNLQSLCVSCHNKKSNKEKC